MKNTQEYTISSDLKNYGILAQNIYDTIESAKDSDEAATLIVLGLSAGRYRQALTSRFENAPEHYEPLIEILGDRLSDLENQLYTKGLAIDRKIEGATH